MIQTYMAEIECDIEITVRIERQIYLQCLRNNGKVNELPDYLFPDGKQIKKHRRRVKRNLEDKTEESEDKKPKLAES